MTRPELFSNGRTALPVVLACASLLVLLTACPGSLENKGEFEDAAPTTAADTNETDTGADTSTAADTGGGDMTTGGCTPENIQETLFVPGCGNDAACHGSAAAGSLNLTDPDVESRVFGVTSSCNGIPLATAGDADGSFFFQKVVEVEPTCGVRMPISVTPLTDDEVACIRAWIEAQ